MKLLTKLKASDHFKSGFLPLKSSKQSSLLWLQIFPPIPKAYRQANLSQIASFQAMSLTQRNLRKSFPLFQLSTWLIFHHFHFLHKLSTLIFRVRRDCYFFPSGCCLIGVRLCHKSLQCWEHFPPSHAKCNVEGWIWVSKVIGFHIFWNLMLHRVDVFAAEACWWMGFAHLIR